MRGFTTFVRFLVRSAWVACAVSVAAPCAAQEGDVPTLPGRADGRGPVFAPSAWVVANTPAQRKVDLKVYGFYIGDLDVPVAQFDVPIRTTKNLTITPSYMYYAVPPSGLNGLAPQPRGYTDSYKEQQFRVDGTYAVAVGKFEISARNMYVRRFRPAPAEDMNRYRGRISVAHPMAIDGHIWKPFASYETFYERTGGWNRKRLWSGVTLPVNKQVFVQPSYLWERSDGTRDVHYVLLGLIVNTR